MFWYIVQSSDSLCNIAEMFGTTVEDIMTLNYLPTPQVFVNQQLLIDGDYSAEATKVKVDSVYDDYMGKYVNIYKISGKNAIFFTSKMAIDVDGAPCSYNKTNTGCGNLKYARGPGILATRPDGKLCTQGPHDPKPGYYVSMTTLEDSHNPNKCDYRKYVNAETIPYFVLPGGRPLRYRKWNVEIGDFGTVINLRNKKIAHAIFADIGPAKKIGEGSIALANALEIPSSRTGGTGKEAYVFYLVYPRSGLGWGKLRTLAEINQIGAREFAAWGGMNQVNTII